MLNVLRENFREKPYLRFVLLAVAAAMVLSLGYYFTSSGGAATSGNWVARVDGVEIPEWQFRERARQVEQQYRQFLGDNYETLSGQLQIRQLVMNDLIDRQLMLADAEALGLRGSAQDLARTIRNHPSLQENGKFIGAENYKAMMVRYPGGVSAFEQSLEQDLIASRWFSLVTQPVMVNDGELRDTFRRRTEKTGIDYLLYTSSETSIDENVNEAPIQQYYNDHSDAYLRPEGRKIRYVVIDRESQAAKIDIPDSDVEAYYQGNLAAYEHPEQRRASQILLSVPAGSTAEARRVIETEAEALHKQLQSGADIAELASLRSDDPGSKEQGGDLGYFGRGVMFEPLEEAVFGTATGELAPVTATPQGFHVIEVTAARDAGTAPLTEVVDDIRRLLRFRQVDGFLKQEADGLRSAIGSSDDFESAAAAAGFEVKSVFFSPDERIPGLAPSPEFTNTVASLDVSGVSQPMRVGAGLALATVDELVPAAPAPLDEVRDSVIAAVLTERRGDAAFAKATSAFAGGKSLGDLATNSIQLQTSGDLAPGQPPAGAGGSSEELEEKLFSEQAGVGSRGVVRVPAGAMIYEITSREPLDEVRFASERAALQDETLGTRRELYRQALMEKLRERVTVEYSARYADGLDQG